MFKPILLTLLLITAMPTLADDCGVAPFTRGDYAAALKPVTECAKQGHAGAQAMLGFTYSASSQGVPQDYKAAVRWYTLAAKQGIALAQPMGSGPPFPIS
jgi:TPR repeat protein